MGEHVEAPSASCTPHDMTLETLYYKALTDSGKRVQRPSLPVAGGVLFFKHFVVPCRPDALT